MGRRVDLVTRIRLAGWRINLKRRENAALQDAARVRASLKIMVRFDAYKVTCLLPSAATENLPALSQARLRPGERAKKFPQPRGARGKTEHLARTRLRRRLAPPLTSARNCGARPSTPPISPTGRCRPHSATGFPNRSLLYVNRTIAEPTPGMGRARFGYGKPS